MLEVRVLGPLEVWADGVSLPLGTPKQQAVLAMLAVRPGRVDGLEELVDELWPEAPPASAVANTRSYAANLRRAFNQLEPTRDLIARRGSGYQLRIRPDQVDLTAFATECHQAPPGATRGSCAQRNLAEGAEAVRDRCPAAHFQQWVAADDPRRV